MQRPPRPAGIYVLAACCLLLAADGAQALPESHGPFFPDEDYALALPTCDASERTLHNDHPAEGVARFEAPGGETLTLRMSSRSDPFETVYVAQAGERSQSAAAEVELPLVSDVAWLLPARAVCADLNGDGKTDFVTDHWRHGNGLGGAFFDKLFVLSSTSGYRFWILSSMFASEADYVGFGSIEPIVIVTTQWANSGGAIPHSYFVYDLWTVRGGEVVSANHIDSRFPKWVWWAGAENHKPASSLSEEAKRQMLAPRVAKEVVGSP